MANEYPVYICYTSNKGYLGYKNKSINADSDTLQKYEHTLFIISEVGLPASNTTSCQMYLGNIRITDIINLNLFNNIDITEDTTTGFLTVTRKSDGEKDVLICNTSKLYIYGKYSVDIDQHYFNIYYYNLANQEYIPITKNGVFTHKVNYVASASDISNSVMWQDRKIVYYPQE